MMHCKMQMLVNLLLIDARPADRVVAEIERAGGIAVANYDSVQFSEQRARLHCLHILLHCVFIGGEW